MLGTGTRGYPLPGYLVSTRVPGSFITRLLSIQHCSAFGVIYNVFHEFNVSLHLNCNYGYAASYSISIKIIVSGVVYSQTHLEEVAPLFGPVRGVGD